MKMEDIETRMAEINELLNDENSDIDALTEEVNALEARSNEIKEEVEKRNALVSKVAEGQIGVVIEERKMEEPKVEEKVYTINDAEYRVAWLKNLNGEDLTEMEKRVLVTGITGSTEGEATDVSNKSLLVPTKTLNEIWSLITEKHPFLADCRKLYSNAVVEIPVHSEGGAAEIVEENNAASAEEANTFVKVTLAGKSFVKYVDITYRMQKMSIDALEDYLAREIADGIGNKMAADAIATVKAGIDAENKVTKADPEFKDVAALLGALKRVSKVNIYANRKTVYGKLVGMVGTDKRPVFQLDPTANAIGAVLGCSVKVEDGLADGEILAIDPDKYVENIVQDVMVETDKDIKKHVTTYSGFAIAEGALVDPFAGALISAE